MARISNIENFNDYRLEKMKIKTLEEESVLFTSEELKVIMIDYLSTEIDFFF